MDVRIRPWEEDDAPALAAAVADSLPELRPWMPWGAEDDASDPDARRAWIREHADGATRDRFRAIEVDGEIAGGCGLHHRVGPEALELGYWVATRFAGRGVATAAVALLVDEAFADPAITHVEIHHDAANHASGAVARRAGFTHVTDVPRHRFADGEATTVWRLTRADRRG